MTKPHLTNNIHIKNEGWEGKTNPFWEWVPVMVVVG
jgi:hypothetical protein